MQRGLAAAHCDENIGVPIGVRDMAFRVLSCFADEGLNIVLLDLGKIWEVPAEWAMQHCVNPDRLLRGR